MAESASSAGAPAQIAPAQSAPAQIASAAQSAFADGWECQCKEGKDCGAVGHTGKDKCGREPLPSDIKYRARVCSACRKQKSLAKIRAEAMAEAGARVGAETTEPAARVGAEPAEPAEAAENVFAVAREVQIAVRSPGKSECCLTVSRDMTILDLKKIIEKSPLRTPVHRAHLFIWDTEARDDCPVGMYCAVGRSTFDLRARGATPSHAPGLPRCDALSCVCGTHANHCPMPEEECAEMEERAKELRNLARAQHWNEVQSAALIYYIEKHAGERNYLQQKIKDTHDRMAAFNERKRKAQEAEVSTRLAKGARTD